MHYVRLNTNGSRGMAMGVACQQMLAARNQADNTRGGMSITTFDQKGFYYVAFQNRRHATGFVEFLRSRNVEFRQLTGLPVGVKMRRLPQPPMLDIPQDVQLVTFEGSEDQLRALFPGWATRRK